MNKLPRVGRLAVLAVCLVATPPQTQLLSGQEVSGRFRVMVLELQPLDESDKRFGERLARQLRERINEMDRHRPIEERELERGLRDNDLDMEDMNCALARQLAPHVDAQVVFCGGYVQEGATYRVEAKFITQAGEEFVVEPVVVPLENGQRQAADHFYQALQIQSTQTMSAVFCAEYASSQQWPEAMEHCDRSIELNPNAVSSRFTRAHVLKNLERNEEALEEFLRVVELDPMNGDALQNAGFIAAMLGKVDDARDYYNRYLDLNPGSASIRMLIAYELAQAGDPLGAMQFIEVGLEIDPDNVDLLEQHGGFAFAAGAELIQGRTEIPPEAQELFRKALGSFTRVYAQKSAEMEVVHLRNMVGAHINLGEFTEAIALAERALDTHGSEPAIWSYYADALRRTGQVDEAIAALDRVLELDPASPNVGARQGKWLLDEGRFDEAIPTLRDAAERGEQTPDEVSNMLFNHAYQEGIQIENWAFAIRALRAAKDFEITDGLRQRLDFFLGYAVLKDAIIRQEPQTKASAEATLPMFQEARRLLQAAAGYAQGQPSRERDRQALLGNVGTYIEIQEAIIRRGRVSSR